MRRGLRVQLSSFPAKSEWYKAAYYQPAAQGGDTDNYWLYPTAEQLLAHHRHGERRR